MNRKVSKDIYMKSGEAGGSRGRAINSNKTLTQNFNASVDADADDWMSSIRLTSTLLRRGKNRYL